METDLVLELTQTLEGLTLKPTVGADEEGCKAKIKIANGFLITIKVSLVDISVLNLSNCNLKSIPREFSVFESLRVLNLSHNKLIKVPECLDRDLKLVEYLDLSYNCLTEFEREPACRMRLKVLLLNNNYLSNIPEWLLYVRCTNLEELDYSYNMVSHLYASDFDIKSNYRLKKLVLQSCYVSEKHFKYLNGIKTLKYFDLSNSPTIKSTNLLKGEKLFENPLFSNTLEVLKLNYLTLSILSDNIVCLVNLKELYLVFNNLSYLPDVLTSLSSLEILDVSENAICYLPEDLYKLVNLKKLIVYSNTLTTLPDLSKMQQLYYLDLYKNLLHDFSFDITPFTHLDLEQNYVKTTELAQYEDYVGKKKNLRFEAKCSGRHDIAKCWSESESSSCSSISSIHENLEDREVEQLSEEYLAEWWDGSNDPNYVRVCTASDDEWTGELPPLVTMRDTMQRGVEIWHRVSPDFPDAD